MIVCVAASPAIDKMFEVDRIEIGAIHRPRAFTQVPGGKGLNCARAAHALGGDVTATAILAGHAGRWIEEALSAEGVRGRFAWDNGETRSCLSLHDQSGRPLTEFYERGHEISSDGWDRLTEIVSDVVPGASWITISGFPPPGAPDDAYERIARIAAEVGTRVAVDTRDATLEHALRAGPALVKVNTEEAAALLGVTIATEDDAISALQEIRTRIAGHNAMVIVTRASQGAVVCDRDGNLVRARLFERGPYPVGSGDAFLGGLVTALDVGSNWNDALRLALGAAAANAEIPGAGRLDPERAMSLARRVVLEPLPRR